MLQKWMIAGKHFVNEMELEDIALMKFCLIAFGTLVGLAIPKGTRKTAGFLVAVVFLTTWGTIMFRFIASLTRREHN